MSQSRRSHGTKKKDRFELELCHVVSILRCVAAMAGALLLLSVVLFAVCEKTYEGNVVYALVILVDAVAFLGSLFGAWWLNRKDEELSRREKEKYRSAAQK